MYSLFPNVVFCNNLPQKNCNSVEIQKSMSLIAIILILTSAFMHAGWNLFSKSKHPTTAFFMVASLIGALSLSPLLVLWLDTLINNIPSLVWVLLGTTGLFQALYYCALAGAYRSGDMSVVYPIARSIPAVLVVIIALLLGQNTQITAQCIFGIILIILGSTLIPVKLLRDFKLRNYLNATCGLALLAAVGTAGYSLLDDQALKLLRTDTSLAMNNTELTLLYACLGAWTTTFWMAILVCLRQNNRQHVKHIFQNHKRHVLLTGLTMQLTYVLVLISFAFVSNVSYVVGFRQLSIPLGASLGILILKEAPHRTKICGVIIVFIGLIFVALG